MDKFKKDCNPDLPVVLVRKRIQGQQLHGIQCAKEKGGIKKEEIIVTVETRWIRVHMLQKQVDDV
jgi:hypothetical protein